MSFERKQVGETETYKGHEIKVRYIGPDLLGEVDGLEMPNFYLNAEAARNACKNYIDETIKAGKKK